MTRTRLPMLASVLAILSMASAWIATFAARPWDIVLVIVTIIGIAITTGMIGYWVSRVRADAIGDRS